MSEARGVELKVSTWPPMCEHRVFDCIECRTGLFEPGRNKKLATKLEKEKPMTEPIKSVKLPEQVFCATRGCWNPAVPNDKFCRKCLAWEDEE